MTDPSDGERDFFVSFNKADRDWATWIAWTLEAAEANLAAVGAAPTAEDPSELVADKGYHSRDGLKGLEDGPWKSRIAEKKAAGVSRWRGDTEARRAVHDNRARLRSGVAKEAFRLRAARPGRHALSPAARPREPEEALPDADRRLRPRHGHAVPGRGRDPAGVPSPSLGAPAAPRHR